MEYVVNAFGVLIFIERKRYFFKHRVVKYFIRNGEVTTYIEKIFKTKKEALYYIKRVYGITAK